MDDVIWRYTYPQIVRLLNAANRRIDRMNQMYQQGSADSASPGGHYVNDNTYKEKYSGNESWLQAAQRSLDQPMTVDEAMAALRQFG